MHHSIIIPYRNRVRELRQTLWSLSNTASVAIDYSGVFADDYEILIVHAGTESIERLIEQTVSCFSNLLFHLHIHVDHNHPRVFNKPRLLNIGIEAAKGDILTFLDADMLVGPDWMHTTQRELLHVPSPPTRLCYRVRQLALEKNIGEEHLSAHEATLRGFEQAEAAGIRDSLLAVVCNTAARFAKAAEAYGQPEWTNNPQVRTPIFGNSQWSILRDVLGSLRFDETFEGAGFEDLDMIDTIWRTVPDYQGQIITDPSASLYHLHHERKNVLGSDWCDPKINLANQRMYYRKAAMRRHAQREREHADAAETNQE